MAGPDDKERGIELESRTTQDNSTRPITKPKRPRGFDTGHHKPGRNVKPGTLKGLEPTQNPPTRRPRSKGITRQQQLVEGIDLDKLSKVARRKFDRLRPEYAKRLEVGVGGDVHHAVELDVLDRYRGVFTEDYLNSFKNMRGIPRELTDEEFQSLDKNRGVAPKPEGRSRPKRLHNSTIRKVWDQTYLILDEEISRRKLEPSTKEYNRLVRRHILAARNQIDELYKQFFTEHRAKEKWRKQQKIISEAVQPATEELGPAKSITSGDRQIQNRASEPVKETGLREGGKPDIAQRSTQGRIAETSLPSESKGTRKFRAPKVSEQPKVKADPKGGSSSRKGKGFSGGFLIDIALLLPEVNKAIEWGLELVFGPEHDYLLTDVVIESKVSQLQLLIDPKIEQQAEEVLELARNGLVYASIKISIEVTPPLFNFMGTDYGAPNVSVSLDHVWIVREASEPRQGKILVGGTERVIGTTVAWEIPIDVDSLRDRLVNVNISGNWVEYIVNSDEQGLSPANPMPGSAGYEQFFASFSVNQDKQGVHVTGGRSSIEDQKEVRLGSYRISGEKWDAATKRLTFSAQEKDSKFEYDLSLIGKDRMTGKVKVWDLSLDKKHSIQINKSVWKRIINRRRESKESANIFSGFPIFGRR